MEVWAVEGVEEMYVWCRAQEGRQGRMRGEESLLEAAAIVCTWVPRHPGDRIDSAGFDDAAGQTQKA